MKLALLCLIAGLSLAGCTVYKVVEGPPSGTYVIVDSTGVQHRPAVIVHVGELDGLRIRVLDNYFRGPMRDAKVTVHSTGDFDRTNRSGWTRKLQLPESGELVRITVEWYVYTGPYSEPITRSFDRTIRLGRGVTEETISVDGSPPR